MGLTDRLKRPFYRGAAQRPWDGEATIQIVGVEPKGGDMALLDVIYWTGEESIWQAPFQRTIRAIIPDGVKPRVGQILQVGTTGNTGSAADDTPPPVFWDRPAPELPPMQFPQGFGPANPDATIDFLQGMVQQRTLDEEGLERARLYLAGGWDAVTAAMTRK